MAKEPDKKGMSRRTFFKAGAAAPLAAGASADKEDNAKKVALVEELTDIMATLAHGITGLVCDEVELPKSSYSPDRTARLDPEAVESELAGYSKKLEQFGSELPDYQHRIQEILRDFGSEGIVYPKTGSVIDKAIGDDNILHPSRLREITEEEYTYIANSHRTRTEDFPEIATLIRNRLSVAKTLKAAAEKIVSEIGSDEPHIAVEDLMYDAYWNDLPPDIDWSEHYHDPANVDAFVKEHLHSEESKRHKREFHKQHLTEQKRKEVAQSLSQFFGQHVHRDDQYYYITVPTVSTELYDTLRNVATLRDKDVEFPSQEEVLFSRIKDPGQRSSWAPAEVRVPRISHALRLPSYVAENLADIVTGEMDLRDMQRINPRKIVAYYRDQSKLTDALAEDLESLHKLVNRKGTNRTQALQSKSAGDNSAQSL